mmetsp:Transcript_12562/g.28044  ORF Transcript_12562/g.28044 Transcript_12562/m.28044 type:complete len:88 (+) Transcript_12562:94-357(+)
MPHPKFSALASHAPTPPEDSPVTPDDELDEGTSPILLRNEECREAIVEEVTGTVTTVGVGCFVPFRNVMVGCPTADPGRRATKGHVD